MVRLGSPAQLLTNVMPRSMTMDNHGPKALFGVVGLPVTECVAALLEHGLVAARPAGRGRP
jgi:hypothetical protein